MLLGVPVVDPRWQTSLDVGHSVYDSPIKREIVCDNTVDERRNRWINAETLENRSSLPARNLDKNQSSRYFLRNPDVLYRMSHRVPPRITFFSIILFYF